jgi:tripartite-type tricarboxylate transporter receptor subunit TctC
MSKLNRRSVIAASAAASLFPGALRAQSWPTKPIRWVVPYTAGGLTDVVTRLTLEKMTVGQNFVVDNKPGANSLIGAEMVANAAPDGYTFLTVIAAHAANKTLYAGKLKFDPVKGFAPISLVAVAPLIITVTNDLPVKTVGELIAYAKKNPALLWLVGRRRRRPSHQRADEAGDRHRHGARALQGHRASAGRSRLG